MHKIFVENLIVQGVHGVTLEEKKTPQSFKVDMWVEVDSDCFDNGDSIENTIDYRMMKQIAIAVIQEEHHNLLETIAQRIITLLYKDHCVRRVHVTVSKPQRWDTGVPGVTIEI